jgi:hypothetical protein
MKESSRDESQRARTSRHVVLALLVAAMLVLAGCGSDKKSGSGGDTTTTGGSSGTTSTTAGGVDIAKFNDEIQQWLIDVGCYKGRVDGIVGPETDAAIVAFQQAEGLKVDGQVGPQTEAALKKAAEEKKTVCGSSSGTTTTTSGTTTTTKPGVAPCTATAIQAALPSGQTVENYVCSGGYAGVESLAGSTTNRYILKDESGTWKNLNQEPCGGASAGIAPQVLEVGCNPPS